MSKMIQIRHVPDQIHGRLKARAALSNMSLSDYLLKQLRHLADRPTTEEMIERLRQRSPLKLKESPAQAVRKVRDRQ